jgi:hypothetical protein
MFLMTGVEEFGYKVALAPTAGARTPLPFPDNRFRIRQGHGENVALFSDDFAATRNVRLIKVVTAKAVKQEPPVSPRHGSREKAG